MHKRYFFMPLALACVLGLIWTTLPQSGDASSHREAPFMMTDPTADLTDVYAFVDENDASMVNLVMNVIPFEDPNGGPNFFRFDPNVLYTLRVDNDGDAVEDLVYEFTFKDAIQNGGTFLYNDGPISSTTDENYNFRQTMSVARVDSSTGASTMLVSDKIVVPENIGPASTPNYESLAAMGVYDLPNGGKVFAGQRDDPFFVDLGAVFDLLTIRGGAPGNSGNGIDQLGGMNVHTIAIQVPAAELNGTDTDDSVIGVWATTSRRKMRVLNGDGTTTSSGEWVQISRLGLPLINEVVVPLAFKDFFNSSQPRNDFDNYVAPFLNDADENNYGPIFSPEVPKLLNLLYGLSVPPEPRWQQDPNDADEGLDGDIYWLLVGVPDLNREAAPPSVPAGTQGHVQPSDMIRLNTSIPAKRPGDSGFSRFGVIGGDVNGYPNGRRLSDDVTDISLRVMAGVLVAGFNMEPNNQLGDGVPTNDREFMTTFPYVAMPWAGFSHDHHNQDYLATPNEPAGTAPSTFSLGQNYPNPLQGNTSTRIEYEMAQAGPVKINVIDLQGRVVRTLVEQDMPAGSHAVQWDGRDGTGRLLASGTYIYRLTSDNQSQARKMVLVH